MDADNNLEIRKSVGARIRRRRIILGWTMANLADHAGCRFQQIHKYETGANEIGAARLFQLAEALDVEVQYFFADIQTLGPSAVRKADFDESSIIWVARKIASLPERVQDRFALLAEAVVEDANAEENAPASNVNPT